MTSICVTLMRIILIVLNILALVRYKRIILMIFHINHSININLQHIRPLELQLSSQEV
jgi:hypothetical protein